MNFHFTTILVLVINQIVKVATQSAPVSPCPKMFQYRFDGNEWFGLLSIKNPEVGKPLQLKVGLSLRGKPTTHYLGEIELLSRGQSMDDSSPILYKILFPKSSIPPRLLQVSVNNRVICYGAADISIFVTQIQLEHTRKFSFFPHDLSLSNKHHTNQQHPSTDSDLFLNDKNPLQSVKEVCGRHDETLIKETIFQIPPRFQSKHETGISRGEWPWLAAIYVNNLTSLSYQCGGTLISSKIVISSAHCFHMYKKQYTANEVLVFLGRHNLKNWNEDGSIAAPCDDIFIHPDYDSNLMSYDADIAVIVLKNDVRFNMYIRPACMWSGSTSLDYIVGERGKIIGWGHSTASHTPQQIEATISSNAACFKANETYRSLSSNRTFCAGDKNVSGRSPCNGDSGAGMMLYKNKRWVLRGIVSASLAATTTKSSCHDNDYVIYTDVAKFLDWIFAFIL